MLDENLKHIGQGHINLVKSDRQSDLPRLDDTDRRLLALLRSDARLPVSSLAAALGLARGTVKSRMAKLERESVILGYSVRMADHDRLNQVRASMLLKVQGRAANSILRTLRGFPEVTSMHVTNGRWDMVLQVAVESLFVLENTLRKIRMVDGILSTETSILLSQQK